MGQKVENRRTQTYDLPCPPQRPRVHEWFQSQTEIIVMIYSVPQKQKIYINWFNSNDWSTIHTTFRWIKQIFKSILNKTTLANVLKTGSLNSVQFIFLHIAAVPKSPLYLKGVNQMPTPLHMMFLSRVLSAAYGEKHRPRWAQQTGPQTDGLHQARLSISVRKIDHCYW